MRALITQSVMMVIITINSKTKITNHSLTFRFPKVSLDGFPRLYPMVMGKRQYPNKRFQPDFALYQMLRYLAAAKNHVGPPVPYESSKYGNILKDVGNKIF